METAHASVASDFVKCKLDEFFWEWLCLPESQKIVRQAIQFAKNENSCVESPAPSPHFSAIRGSSSGRPSPPGSPHSRGCLRDSLSVSSDSSGPPGADWSASVTTPSPPQRNAGVAAATGYESSGASRPTAARLETKPPKSLQNPRLEVWAPQCLHWVPKSFLASGGPSVKCLQRYSRKRQGRRSTINS